MLVQGTNITMIRGDTEAFNVTLQDEDGAKVDLVVGDTVYFTVKTSINTHIKILQKVVTEFVDGVAQIKIEPQDTKELKFDTYVYDVQISFASGAVKTIIPPSDFIVSGEITYE